MGSLVKTYSNEKLTGKVYSPNPVVKKILDDASFCQQNVLGKSILDPSCGDGRFLVEIVRRILQQSPQKDLAAHLQNVHGWDIDPKALASCQQHLDALVKPLAIQVKWNLVCQDSLSAIESRQQQFDFVVGNPPYVRVQHLDTTTRTYLKQHFSFCQKGAFDIYFAFFELAFHLLKETGTGAFITPNSYFYTHNATILRNLFTKKQLLIQVSNFHHFKLFEDIGTYCAISIFGKKKRENFLYQSAIRPFLFEEKLIDYKDFKSSIWDFSFQAPQYEQVLKNIAKIHVGLTTLKDKAYIFDLVETQDHFCLVDTPLKGKQKIERSLLRPIVKASRIKDGAIKKQWILFPYYQDDNQVKIIPEAQLKSSYPFAYKYLKSIKTELDKRDNGKPNKVAWYAFGRSQGLKTSFGDKILFSPINLHPHFVHLADADTCFYSGYCIKYDGDKEKLLQQLNSPRMQAFVQSNSRDFSNGWKAYNKMLIERFPIDTTKL